jgi:hypothetical protein
MTTTPQKIQKLLDEHTESVSRAFIEYLCLHSKADSAELRQLWKSFKNNEKPRQVAKEKTVVSGRCQHTFTRGNKIGEQCGIRTKDEKMYCTKHLKGKKTAVITKEELEKDIEELVSEEESQLEEDDNEVEVDDTEVEVEEEEEEE